MVTDLSLGKFPSLVFTEYLCLWQMKGVAEPFHCQKQHGRWRIRPYEDTNHSVFLDPTEGAHQQAPHFCLVVVKWPVTAASRG